MTAVCSNCHADVSLDMDLQQHFLLQTILQIFCCWCIHVKKYCKDAKLSLLEAAGTKGDNQRALTRRFFMLQYVKYPIKCF